MAPARKKQKLENGSVAAVEAGGQAGTPRKEAPGKAEQQRRSLFVRGLPATATTESLTELFSESYPVKHATAVIDPATKQCRGYGFVTFADAEDAAGAKKEFSGHDIEGKKLRIELAEPRHRDGEDGATAAKNGEGTAGGAKKGQDIPQPSRLIVRNLPWTIKTPEQLSKLFLSYGKVKQAYIPKKGHGLSAGFGFVVLRGRKNAEKALEGVNGKSVDGRTLAVDWAVSKDVYEEVLRKDGDDEGNDSGEAGEDGGLEEGESEAAEHSEAEEDTSGDEDEEDDYVDIQVDGEPEGADRTDERASTLFVRNLPFTCTDEDLEDHFSQFGNTRYARVVIDAVTGRSKGTGFVCFYRKEDTDACLRSAPRRQTQPNGSDQKQQPRMQNSILQNDDTDPSGQYTLDGRVLQVSRAVDKSEATRLTDEGAAHRHKRNEDKRRLYLLSEGTIPSNSKLWESLAPSERTMREASAKQRKTLIESNPSLHLSLTRLSVRNIPRSIGSTELKALAREAVVGFAMDVKAGSREKISKEELIRGGEQMQQAEQARKKAGRGVVKQAKVVFEGAGGSKVREDTGAGRSRGYGFIEYHTHRNALMGLRWLNGHAIGYQVKDPKKAGAGKMSREEVQDRKKRLIVEFAIENAQVVMRRQDREDKARDRSEAVKQGKDVDADIAGDGAAGSAVGSGVAASRKRKRGADPGGSGAPGGKKGRKGSKPGAGSKPGRAGETAEGKKAKTPIDEKIAKRNHIVGRKRAMRKAKRSGGK